MKLKQYTAKSIAAICAAGAILSLSAVQADDHKKGDHDDHKHENGDKDGHDHDGDDHADHDHGDRKGHDKDDAGHKGHDKNAAEHDDHAALVGPNKGRILHDVEPHAELFVTKDRKIKITFLDDHGKVVPAKGQTIKAICGKLGNPTRLTLAKDGDSLLSDKALPDGKNIPTILQVKMTPESKTKNIRLNLNLADCPSCDHLEYACICDHHGDHKHAPGDAHKHE